MKRSLATAAVLALATAATAQTIYSNNAGGDAFTNPTTTNTNPLTPGAAIGSSGWYYTNVRNSGVVGISSAYPRSGNGSVEFIGTQGPAGNSSKADIEYIPGTVMGTLGTLSALGYDWYKNPSSAATQHPSIRLYIDADGQTSTTMDRGYLVYERAYNGGSVPTGAWQSDDVFGADANLWQVVFGVGTFDTAGNIPALSVWSSAGGFTPTGGGLNFSAASAVYGVSLGIGSGWNTFDGAIDNVTIGFGGVSQTFNFEVVPAPGTASLLAMGGLLAARRRRK